MLESILADVLTRVLGQYLEGIDRDSVRFGAWSGLVELRGVALRPEALAVLFETLGMDLPVTVEAGFIGLLRLQVPWNAIGTTPVQILMEDITIMARPVRGDGSDDSELRIRERRITRAKLNTDDAVREASWGVSDEESTGSRWASWLVSDQLRAKIIDNIQITLKGILLRFEDPFSDPRRPYIASIGCDSLKVISTDENWRQAFVERKAEDSSIVTRKLLEVMGFRIDWAPITPKDAPGLSRGTASGGLGTKFETPEKLKQFVTGGISSGAASRKNDYVQSLLHPVDGSLRLRFLAANRSSGVSAEASSEPALDFDIRFPGVVVDLDDVQYACLLQTSVYFAKLATRGFRPKTPKERWLWAVDQLLPGFSERRRRLLMFTEEGICAALERSFQYYVRRKSLLKARRMSVEEPRDIADELERIEDELSYEEVIALRDYVDRRIEKDKEHWSPVGARISPTAGDPNRDGTTVNTLWRMLGYKDEKPDEERLTAGENSGMSMKTSGSTFEKEDSKRLTAEPIPSSLVRDPVSLRAAFLLQAASIHLAQNGYPQSSTPRVALKLKGLRVGITYTEGGSLVVEALLKNIEAWDLLHDTKMVYSRVALVPDSNQSSIGPPIHESVYPHNVSEAIEAIRSGSNPAKELLHEDETCSTGDDDFVGDHLFDPFDNERSHGTCDISGHERRESRQRARGNSESRDSTPSSSFRVAESEFWGNLHGEHGIKNYVAAFRYSQINQGGAGSTKVLSSKLDVSVATLEAIVDGPKGSFVWGFKFWQPKGMAQDPIMAFLGAAAGARIAELRMEIEKALLANKVPMQINAVILAPRFVFPSLSKSAPAVVVNMGTLGVCTSESSPVVDPSHTDQDSRHVQYSSYVLTLDNLGVYFSPNLSVAITQRFERGNDNPAAQKLSSHDFAAPYDSDTAGVERIVRPFSLRFILQTLRDSTVVQVAHASTELNPSNLDSANIAKVRVRGNIPGLNLILTQIAFQHIVMEARRWGTGLRPKAHQQSGSHSGHPSGEGWQPIAKDDKGLSIAYSDSNNLASHFHETRISLRIDEDGPPPTALASYDLKILLEKVSVELRTTYEARLVTAIASKMQASVVKTGRRTLQASFRLQSWSVTDASRGRTAAFRGLAHAGTITGSKGFSPPRGSSMATRDVTQPASMEKDFVNIQYTLDLVSNEHKFAISFLSLNIVCVRETYIRLASFFYSVYRAARNSAIQTSRECSSPADRGQGKDESGGIKSEMELTTSEVASVDDGNLRSKILLTSRFDGFSFQLVASGGAIAFVEVRNSKIQFLRDRNASMEARGDFQYFSVKDLTAPIADHSAVLTYEKFPAPSADTKNVAGSNPSSDMSERDEWVLSIPKATNEQYEFRASFRGINACLLYRFSFVLQQYFTDLIEGIKPVIRVVLEQVGEQVVASHQSHPFPSLDVKRKSSPVMLNLQLSDLTVRLPRHSGCSSEALTITTSRINFENRLGEDGEIQWLSKFKGVQYAVDYVPSTALDGEGYGSFTSAFMKDFEANMTVQKKVAENISPEEEPLSYILGVHLQVSDNVLIELCEAQYTVLYFILTENLAETITGSELSIDFSHLAKMESVLDVQAGVSSDVEVCDPDARSSTDIEEERPVLIPTKERRRNFIDVNVSLPYLGIELSRGWDVTNESCKILGLYFHNVQLGFTYSKPHHLFFELAGKLLSIADLTKERSSKSEIFVVPVQPEVTIGCASSGGTEAEQTGGNENITLTYEKENGDRPSIVVYLKGLQIEVIPELFRDLSYLAIPGWPFLESSAIALDIAYIGRTMAILLSKSQVVLRTDEGESDRRAIALTGEYQLKIDWMRGTGAKTILLQSTQVEVSTSPAFPRPVRADDFGLGEVFYAPRLEKGIIPLVYPTNSSIEYVAAEVDEGGCRLNISVDSVLCLINIGKVPLLKSLISRPSRMKPTYLQGRQWVQPSNFLVERADPTDAKNEGARKARENMSLSVTIPAARYLITDEANGRYIPVLEIRLKSFDFTAHVGSMVQVHGEIAADLFNAKKGWWEPAVESWSLSASVSHGNSGTRAIVIKSEQRLNLNVTPTTVSTVINVVKSLKSAGSRELSGDSDSLESTNDKDSREIHGKVRSQEKLPTRRPSVAAFLMRNELGIPVYMSSTGSPRQNLVPTNAEVETGIHSEDLVSSTPAGERSRRDHALKCRLRIPGFVPLDLSAAEIGKHSVTFFPSQNLSSSRDNLRNRGEPSRPIRALWEVEMANGIPVCTLRSLFRFLNQTETLVQLLVESVDNVIGESSSGSSGVIAGGKSFALPIDCENCTIRIRPHFGDSSDQKEIPEQPGTISRALFDWSPCLPSLFWLTQNAREEPEGHSDVTISRNSALRRGRNAIIRCQSTQGGSTDFFFAVTTQSPDPLNARGRNSFPWVDIVARAPVVLCNNLPRTLSYRVVHRKPFSGVRSEAVREAEGIVVAAGTVQPLKQTHLHFSEEDLLKTTFLSLAFNNCTGLHAGTHSLRHGHGFNENAPARFGPEVSFGEICSRKTPIVLPSAVRSVDGKGQPRRDFRATVLSRPASYLRFDIFAGFWIRNRSDTPLVICSRNSYYGAGSQAFHLRACPPQQLPDDFVCFEGPYLSIRVPKTNNSNEDLLEQSEWWTSPSVLEDIDKPLIVGLRGLSLQLEVSPAELSTNTSIVTVRNHSWICNRTSSTLQWCQTSALDSRGNCVLRLVKTLPPGEFHGIHWDQKTSYEAVHLRVAEGNGQSDWIWSPAIPLNIGHSRELPAKMYRPKTHEQYIARVASKEIAAGSTALVIYGEDRHNPPYRIINLCRHRAIAFSQVGSLERPWLVRAGKTTRYSWDNPLAPPSQRLLSVRILEPEDLIPKQRDVQMASSSESAPSHHHEKYDLNIDVVGDRAMVLSDSFDPVVVISISVDGATKIVTFCEEDKNGQLLVSTDSDQLPRDDSVDSPVPVLGWDDFGNNHVTGHLHTVELVKDKSVPSTEISDYPTRYTSVGSGKHSKRLTGTVNTDAAVFLDSIGISVITSDPSELMYISWKDVHVNYESTGTLESLALHVDAVQVDNQLERTPYPVLMWTSTTGISESQGHGSKETVALPKALAIEVHRTITDDDILMVKSFQAAIRPFSVCFEDEFVSKVLGFLSDTAIMGREPTSNVLNAPDRDYQEFEKISTRMSKNVLMGAKGSRLESIPASKRIYVHSFKIYKTSLRLTSSGSGSAVAKAAGINSSAKALVALVLNVENCEFSFPLLHVENIFDSMHHFAILVKEYYVSQARNQRMKLLASNSLVGNPAALFDAVGTGARDFFVEPGRAKGGADFIVGVGRGSKSLFANTVGGLVQSVGSIPRAVSSGLEKAVGDNDYLAERERIRGSNVPGSHRGSSAKNPAQGLATGAISFAHGISSGVTGFIKEPVQGAKQGGAGGFLKGIGRAFIGGVAKPVAGAIDLVAEPAVGLSRQITDTEQSSHGGHDRPVVPERPPRAFRGRNQRLDSFDMRYSVGVCLYNAVQLVSGVSYDGELLDWIELSGRHSRRDGSSEEWVWNIMQRYSRAMPGTKRQIRAAERALFESRAELGIRPEKIRVALVTMKDVVIATLDCKLVTSIPFWRDCLYDISGKGKEVHMCVTLKSGSNSGPREEVGGLFSGAHSFISAPWDAPDIGQRVKPKKGEWLREEIACGSSEARDELITRLKDVMNNMEEVGERWYRGKVEDSAGGQESSSVELRAVSKWQEDRSSLEMKETAREERGESGSLAGWMSGKDKGGSESADVGSSSVRREGKQRGSEKRRLEALRGLQKRIERLKGRGGKRGVVRMVIANRLERGRRLELMESWKDEGRWNVEAPLRVESLDAEVAEVEGEQIVGGMKFKVVNMVAEALGESSVEMGSRRDGAQGFVSLQFGGEGRIVGWGEGGIQVIVEQEDREGGGLVGVFSIEEGESNAAEKNERQQAGKKGGMSDEEMLVDQLVEIGFGFEEAVVALAEAGGDMVKAVDILTR